MTTHTEQELEILRRYSAGEIGWRAACGKLALLDIGELHDMLEEAGLAEPEEVADGA